MTTNGEPRRSNHHGKARAPGRTPELRSTTRRIASAICAPSASQCPCHVECRERVQLLPACEQINHRARHVRQVCPLVTDATLTGHVDGRHRLSPLDQAMREPVVARSGSEEIAGSDDDHASPKSGSRAQSPLELDTDRALARCWMLRRVLVEHRECIRAIVVDGARQHDCRPLRELLQLWCCRSSATPVPTIFGTRAAPPRLRSCLKVSRALPLRPRPPVRARNQTFSATP